MRETAWASGNDDQAISLSQVSRAITRMTGGTSFALDLQPAFALSRFGAASLASLPAKGGRDMRTRIVVSILVHISSHCIRVRTVEPR